MNKRIKNSFDTAVHHLSSPQDQHGYEDGKHPPKEFIKFKKAVFREMVCYISLNEVSNWQKIIKAKGSITYFKNPIMMHPWLDQMNKALSLIEF